MRTALAHWRWLAGRRADAALALGLGAMGVYELATDADQSRFPRGPLAMAFVLAITIPLAWRVIAPVAVAATTAVAALMEAVLQQSSPFGAFFGVLVASYSVVAHGRGRLRLAAAAGLVVAITPHLFEPGSAPTAGNLIFTFAPLSAAMGLGALQRRRLDREQLLLERAEAADAESAARAEAAAAAERAKIARELHDVVAHSLGVTVLHASAARRNPADREAVAAALEAIEMSSRQGLAEMRRLLHVMRSAGSTAELAPQPGLAGLGELVAKVGATGVDVSLTTEGELSAVPAGVELNAYRIVQEALTNVVKHATASHAEVRLRRVPGELTVEVTDDGPGPAQPPPAAGHGLIGMRERVALFGGSLESGPGPERGFRIRATLPFQA